jgi:hypothetical protein
MQYHGYYLGNSNASMLDKNDRKNLIENQNLKNLLKFFRADTTQVLEYWLD